MDHAIQTRLTGRSKVSISIPTEFDETGSSALAPPVPMSQVAIQGRRGPPAPLAVDSPMGREQKLLALCALELPPHRQKIGPMRKITDVVDAKFRSHLRERSLQSAPWQIVAIACVAFVLGCEGRAFAAGRASPDASGAIAAAVADSARPTSDTSRDADRKPNETLAFSGVKPGDHVADYVADTGYFTRLFSTVVGTSGHVYAVEPTGFFKYKSFPPAIAELEAYAVAHPNVTVTTAAALEGLKFPEKLDLFWISQNYHDLHDKFMGPADIAAFNKAVYKALKPGGFYVVLDHSAAPDAPADVTETLHRIGSSTVRREIEAAGFKFDSESSILANPSDPRTARVFDPSIRGHTDQFFFKFRKPR